MTRDLDLGFIALTDSAPLLVAEAHGLFEAEGLHVTLHREVSWATIRDKVATGLYQGAHMLAPMALAARLGVGSEAAAMIAPLSLNTNSAGLGVSAALAARMTELKPDAPLSPQALALAAAERRDQGLPAISFAVVFPYSMHNYMLRYWAASAGIDPDRDIRIVVAPPTAIAARLRSGEIDGFCVGAPWGDVCSRDSGARFVLHASDFWPGGPEKVLGLGESWAARNEEAVLALSRAVLRGALWADQPENAQTLAEILSRSLEAPAAIIAERLNPGDTRVRFARSAAAFPWRSHAAWLLSQMLRWGQVPAGADLSAALSVYRPDLYRRAAADVGVAAPVHDAKIEGAHAEAWALEGSAGPMPRDSFFDGAPFDSDSLRAYAAGFAITRARS